MAEGRVAFNGRSSDAIDMWNSIGYPLPRNYNPADHFLNTLGLAAGKQRQHTVNIAAVITGLVYLGTPIMQSTIMNINGVLFTLVCDMNFLFQFVVVETPQYIVLPLLFTAILYWMAGLAPDIGSFALCCLINILMANTAISVGYAMSCIFEELSIAVNVMPAFVMPALAFAGFFINQNTLPIYFFYFKYISYFGYAYESLIINEWTHVDYIPGCTSNTTCLQTGVDVIESLDFKISNLYSDIISLLVMTVVIRIIAFVALYIRASRRK
ncbi:unnamed protein product [Toxocara canis]|uniref:ABC2_membrane domain-containing protein n=1 Tax=Toxocara canis TaxID=6265 RepID=A0A183TYX8_TOXCA|nr:unnamed protein product [Toxocara canis]